MTERGGFVTPGQACGGRGLLSLEPPQIAQDPLVASFPAQGLRGAKVVGKSPARRAAWARRPPPSTTCR
ncbi:hypothetical protein [Streptomyces sp. NPDC060022]|uniref:hypothetical protein n=1 Tax=Streptomyces sp. NPDC060022 TaxID=3347039 RepID=UPI00367DFA93